MLIQATLLCLLTTRWYAPDKNLSTKNDGSIGDRFFQAPTNGPPTALG